jgi:hypothetical protein
MYVGQDAAAMRSWATAVSAEAEAYPCTVLVTEYCEPCQERAAATWPALSTSSARLQTWVVGPVGAGRSVPAG